MQTVTLPAHFDGDKIVLDEPYELEPDTRLIVTVLPRNQIDPEHEDWLELSKWGLARAYGDDEPEYTIDMVKELNPEYQPRGSSAGTTPSS